MRAVKIDNAGRFAADLDQNEEYTGKPGTAPAYEPGRFIDPRWNGSTWEEAAPADQVAARENAIECSRARNWRDAELRAADTKVWDATDRGDNLQAQAWAAYRVALRDWPQSAGFPLSGRPEAPQ